MRLNGLQIWGLHRLFGHKADPWIALVRGPFGLLIDAATNGKAQDAIDKADTDAEKLIGELKQVLADAGTSSIGK